MNDQEYWDAKSASPMRAAPRVEPSVTELRAERDRLPAALVASTMLLCLTAIIVAVILKL